MSHRFSVVCALIFAMALAAISRAQCPPHWHPGDGVPGVDDGVLVIRNWDPDGPGPIPTRMLVGGAFVAAGKTVANHIAWWDPDAARWVALGQGLNGSVADIAVLPGGDLIVCGTFTRAGTIDANYVARWNVATSSWSALGGGMSGGGLLTQVNELAVLTNGDVIAGGRFTMAGGAPANNIARWNGGSWSALGAGVTSPTLFLGVLALVSLPDGGFVAGGDFRDAGGSPASFIARWTPGGAGGAGGAGTWSALGGGTNDWVSVLTLMPTGELVVGGLFRTAGGITVNQIAMWNFTTSTWSGLGTGLTPSSSSVNNVRAIATTAAGDVYVGGSFTGAGGLATYYIAKWKQPTGTGNGWSKVGEHGANADVRSLAILPDGRVALGGNFQKVGNLFGGPQSATAFRIAAWDPPTGAWSRFGDGIDAGVTSLLAVGNDFIAGGGFTQIGGVQTRGIARYNSLTRSWSSLGSGLAAGGVSDMALAPNGDIIACGSFNSIGGVAVQNIARWNGTAWSALGAGFDNTAEAVAVLPNGSVVAGGFFNNAGGQSIPHLALWNGTAWSSIGAIAGGNFWVTRFLVLPNGDLIAAGDFTSIGGVPAQHIARRSAATGAWSALGPGLPFNIWALTRAGNGDIIAGCEISSGVSGAIVNRWDGAAWSPMILGNGGSGYRIVFGLATAPNGDVLAVGGNDFSGPSNLGAAGIARFNGSTWLPLGSGVRGTTVPTIYSVAAMANGDVAASGYMSLAGDYVSASVALWSTRPTCPADFNCSESVEVLDVFDFCNAWLAGDIRTDFDGVGGLTQADIFAFIAAWFTPC